MQKYINKAKVLIQENKKTSILLGVLLFLLVSSKVAPLFGEQENFNTLLADVVAQEYYTANGNININNKSFDVVAVKTENNFTLSVENQAEDIKYNNLISIYNNTLYLNPNSFQLGSNLISLPLNEQEFNLVDLFKDTVKLTKKELYTKNNDFQVISTKNNEDWKSYFSSLNANLSENKESLVDFFKNKELAETEFNKVLVYISSIAETENSIDSFSFMLRQNSDEDNSYNLKFDITLPFEDCPDFVVTEQLDSNQFKFSGDITIKLAESITVQPSGAVKDADTDDIHNFIIDLWNSAFDTAEYVSFNTVTLENNVVTKVYDLGDTQEIVQYVFDNEKATYGTLTVNSYNYTAIKDIANKYKFDTNEIIKDIDNGYYYFTVKLKDEILDEVNKISSSAKEFSSYLKTDKGDDILA